MVVVVVVKHVEGQVVVVVVGREEVGLHVFLAGSGLAQLLLRVHAQMETAPMKLHGFQLFGKL